MTSKSQNHRSRFGARNTLFIDQNDAAYWLAAENFVDDDEGTSEVGSSKAFSSQDLKSKEGLANSNRVNYPMSLGLSQKRPLKTNLIPPSNTFPSSTPPSNYEWAYESDNLFVSPRRPPPTPDMALQQQGQGLASPISPLSPITPALKTRLNSPSLLPPVDIRSRSVEPPSPNLSLLLTPDLNLSKRQYSASVEDRSSTQTFSSDASHLTVLEPSQVGKAIISSFPTPPQREGRARMIDFSQLKKQAKGTIGFGKEALESPKSAYNINDKSSRPVSKPLPPPPLFEEERDCGDDNDSFEGLYTLDEEGNRKSAQLNAWSMDTESAAYPGTFPTSNASHRPLCPYADHLEVSTDHCGCSVATYPGPYPNQKFNNLAVNSAPDLLDLVNSGQHLEGRKKQEDMQRAKNVLYRLSNEIRAMESDQKAQEDKPLKKNTIKFVLPESKRKHIDLSQLNRDLPARPSEDGSTEYSSQSNRDLLFPPKSILQGHRSPSPGPSYGLAAGMLHACLSPRSPSPSIELVRHCEKKEEEESIPTPAVNKVLSIRPKRSFDMLKKFRAESPTPATGVASRKAFTPSPPFAATRQMISTVRSHDRWNSNGSSSSSGHSSGPARRKQSPTRQQDPGLYQWNSPWQQIRSQTAETATEISRHHRQTSSKSSSSSGSTFTSSNGSFGTPTTTSDSMPSTPVRSKLQSKGQPSMYPIIESSKDGVIAPPPSSNNTPSNNSRMPMTFRRQKQDLSYFVKAIEPFPLEAVSQSNTKNKKTQPYGRGELAPPLPPPLPAGHRLLNGRTIEEKGGKRMNVNQVQTKPQPKQISRSNSDQNNSYGFAL